MIAQCMALLFMVATISSGLHSIERSKIRRAAEKAVAYAIRNEARLTAQDIATLLELDRKFRLRLNRSHLGLLQARQESLRRTPLWRFADENYIASESEVKGMKGNDRITASALYCDKYVLPWDFYQELEAMSVRGDFDATRAFLAIGLLNKRGCTYDTGRVASVRESLRKKLRQIAADEKSSETLQVEAMLFLVLAGYRSDVDEQWVARLIRLQQDDGRFGRIPYTTLLAARMLLEYLH